MRAEDDILRTILGCVEKGRFRADDVMGFIFERIDDSVREAELAARGGSKPLAVERLRELQALSERLICILAPAEKSRPRLVAAA
jgi:hypothetical protein